MLKPCLTAAALTLAALTPASAFVAKNSLIVSPTGPDSFEIGFRGKSSTPAFWCAAGDYVVRDLGLSAQTRIYRTSGPRRAGQGMRFSLSGEGAQSTGLLILGKAKSLSAAHARLLCNARVAG